jgi:predicted metal-dependent HD superfamily phosphohydrolase
MGLSMRWRSLAGSGPRADRCWDVLWAGYSEGHRHYHGIAHVDRVISDVELLLDRPLGAESSGPAIDGDAVRLAAWFHDVVYNPRSKAGVNEEASALLGAEAAVDLGFTAAQAEAVARLIRATATHSGPDIDAAAAVLLDADLAILGAPADAYAAYADGVRAEYAHVPDDGWRVGRAAVLRSFLDRPVIYRTPQMTGREAQARANLATELAALGELGARLSG